MSQAVTCGFIANLANLTNLTNLTNLGPHGYQPYRARTQCGRRLVGRRWVEVIMSRHACKKGGKEMPPYIIARSSAPVKPPALSKDSAVRLWYANRQLRQTNREVFQSKERHKASAAAASKRCLELESRLSEIERRANDAEARVQQLCCKVAKYESWVAWAQAQANAVPRLLRQKLLCAIRRFHPDRTRTTDPDEVTKALNALLEEVDAAISTTPSHRP